METLCVFLDTGNILYYLPRKDNILKTPCELTDLLTMVIMRGNLKIVHLQCASAVCMAHHYSKVEGKQVGISLSSQPLRLCYTCNAVHLVCLDLIHFVRFLLHRPTVVY